MAKSPNISHELRPHLRGDIATLRIVDSSNESTMRRLIEEIDERDRELAILPKIDEMHQLSFSAEANHMTFIILSTKTGCAVGFTRILDINLEHKKLHIGSTYICPHTRRTGINIESKFLLLDFSFNDLRVNRVEFMADCQNAVSIRSLQSIGAVQEGVLRNHLVMHNGRIRDSIIFSITSDEWSSPSNILRKKILAIRSQSSPIHRPDSSSRQACGLQGIKPT
jgi:N-acetyltransferase